MAGDHATGQALATLAHIEKLQRDRRHRDARGAFFVEGVRNVVGAVDAGHRVEAALFSETLCTAPVARMIVRRLRREGVPVARASPEDFRRVSSAERASGVGLVVRQRVERLHEVTPRAHTSWIVLRRVRSPGNLGTLVRTSAAVGGAGFILVGGAVDPFEPSLVRATMGAIFRQRFVRTGLDALRHWLRRHRLRLVGATPDGDVDFDRIGYPSTTLVALGEERAGLDEELRGLCDRLVRIPMVSEIDSLNLGVAGSLMLYESRRGQRKRSASQ